MGFRFRNTIHITPEIPLKLGKNGVSLCASGPGATVIIGAKGAYRNIGLPETGITYRSRLEPSPCAQRCAGRERQCQSWQESHSDSFAASCALDEKGNLLLQDSEGQALSNAERRALWEQHEAILQDWLNHQMAVISGEDDLLLNVHEGTPSPTAEPPQADLKPFTELEPIAPITFLPRPAPDAPTPPALRPWHRWSGHLARRRQHQHQRAMIRWREATAESEAAMLCALQQEAQTKAEQQRRREAWRAAEAAFGSEQHRLAETFGACLRSDKGLMTEVLSSEIERLDWPRETLIDFQIDAEHRRVLLDVDLPGIEAIPGRSARLGANGQRLLIKNKSQKQTRLDYARHCHGICLRIVGVIFATLPDIQRIELSAYTQQTDEASGDTDKQYLLAVGIDRSAFSDIDFTQLDQLDPVIALEQFELRRDMIKSGLLRPIEPFGVPESTPIE